MNHPNLPTGLQIYVDKSSRFWNVPTHEKKYARVLDMPKVNSIETSPSILYQADLLKALCCPNAYRHPVDDVNVVETHISWILLTGGFAYKIKKPVDLGFLDFSSLEKRKYYCDEELRLNKRQASEIYLEVVPITGNFKDPKVGGRGKPFEYAIKMVQFLQSVQLDNVLANGKLTLEMMEGIAENVAAFHEGAPVANVLSFNTDPEPVITPARENFKHIESMCKDPCVLFQLEFLREWTEAEFAKLRDDMIVRQGEGFTRECHGDLHLSNLVVLENRVVPFDCIEFSPSLRNIDIINDTAFLMMDLLVRNRQDLAYRFLSDYLECTGDYGAIKFLTFYLVYRSLVRAKVACLQNAEGGLETSNTVEVKQRIEDHVALSKKLTQKTRSCLILTFGVSGAGKSWLSQRLLSALPALRIRSDVERKRLFGLKPKEQSGSGIVDGLYTEEANRRTYNRLLELTKMVLTAGFSLIVDAAYLQREKRKRFEDFARDNNIPFVILECRISKTVLRQRLNHRIESIDSVSEATLEVLNHQFKQMEPLTQSEQKYVIAVDTEFHVDMKKLAARIKSRTG